MRNAIHAAALAAGLLASGAAAAATISITCGGGVGGASCREGSQAWAQASGHTIRPVDLPQSPTEMLALYQQMLAAGSGDIDVFMIDVVWPGILGQHFVDLKEHVDEATKAQHFPAMLENNIVDGRLVALPWYTDAGLLYYRQDLLEKHGRQVPATWAELTETAQAIQDAERAAGNDRMVGFVFQGKSYEGLTCVALEWIDSFGGGTFIDESGKITVNNPRAAAALEMAAGWVGTIAPRGVLGYGEEEARGVFQSGNAVFMRNWPYAWALAQGADSPVRGKVGVAMLPSGGEGGKRSAALGGWQLAVSKYSPNAEAAIELVKYMTSPAEQKRRAMGISVNPTIKALYEDQEMLAANPFMRELLPVFQSAVARPARITGTRYNQVSSEIQAAVHEVLSGNAEPAARLALLEQRLERLSRGGRW